MLLASLHSPTEQRCRIGFLAGWQVYDGATLERYLHDVLRGAVHAATKADCDLLLACGVGPPTRPYRYRPAWPVGSDQTDLVPVGPWNCDGLLVVTPISVAAGAAYIQQLHDTAFPVVYAGASEAGPTVAIDNAAGIALTVQHLKAHGHQAIAFIAGHDERSGDSAERLRAFYQAMADAGLPVDPQLVVQGNHSIEESEEALRALLRRNRSFSAVIASNDNAAIGALAALTQAGIRVPEEIAVVGFDDLLDACVQTPPLTTVHHSAFDLGYQSVIALLDLMAGRWDGHKRRNIPVRLVVRQSCGCRPGLVLNTLSPSNHLLPTHLWNLTARAMNEAIFAETRQHHADQLADLCYVLLEAFQAALHTESESVFQTALVHTLRTTEQIGEDAHGWHAAMLALQQALPELLDHNSERLLRAERLIGWAHLTISDRTRRQTTRSVLRQIDLADRVGTMTAQLLANLDEQQIAATLAEHLARLNIAHVLVALYEAEGDNSYAWSRVVLSVGLPADTQCLRFATREFPPAGCYPIGQPMRLSVLPLVIDGVTAGFVAFAATNFEPCAVIMRNLASALRTSSLYRAAAEGRRLAEEANQLKTRFLSMVSHELRTPLSVVVGLSEMLLRDVPQAEYDSSFHADVTRIYTSAQHLGQLIGDVLDLTSSDAGQLRLNREVLDLHELMGAVVGVGEHMAHAKGLRWHSTIVPPGLHVLGDRTRLRQIALNLVSNAVKFTDTGGITFEVSEQAGEAILTVTDTGIGIAPEEQAHIFDVFRRTQASMERGYGGMGLGLTICRQLVELHNGRISIYSSGVSGAGTRVQVTLPTLATTTRDFRTPLPHDLLIIGPGGDSLAVQLTAQGYHVRSTTDLPADPVALLTPMPGAVLLNSAIAALAGPILSRFLQTEGQPSQVPVLIWDDAAGAKSSALIELNLLAKPLRPGQLTQAVLRAGLDQAEGPTVLIVDDTPHIRTLHMRIVREALPHADIREAADGRAALRLMEEHLPDLVLLDLMMPELDGFGVLEAMQADPRTRAVPVLVLTARPLDDADLARLQRGVASILAKGLFSIEETVGHITAAIQRQRRLSSQTRRMVHRALAFMHEHYAAAISRDLIAAHVGVSENYLSECFQAEMGIAPMTYLMRYRISRARSLLEQSDISITAVALAVGFNDSAYFSRVFQREIGMSPRAYRRIPPKS